MKLAFYVYFYGSDNNRAFKIPNLPSLKYDCYYYTNNKRMMEQLKATKWISVFDNRPTVDDIIESNMIGKYVKSSPHKFKELKDYDYLVYLDSKVSIVSDAIIEDYIQKYFIEQNYALLIREHWYLKNHIWNEFAECFNHQRYRLETDRYIQYIMKQKSNGLDEIAPDLTLCQGGGIIRNMKHVKINEINDTWYQHIVDCGINDQISFFFIRQLFAEYIYVFKENIYG